MGAKKTLWIAWIINFVFGFLFCICAIVNASAVDKIRDHAHGLGDSSTEDLITAIVTTQAYGVVMCIIYGTFSLLVLLRKTTANSGAGVMYGVIIGSAVHMFFALAQVSALLMEHESWIKSLPAEYHWESDDKKTYEATYVMGFISCVLFFVLAVVKVFCISAVTKGDEPYDSFRDRYAREGGASANAA